MFVANLDETVPRGKAMRGAHRIMLRIFVSA
jgi:hypothetical protein